MWPIETALALTLPGVHVGVLAIEGVRLAGALLALWGTVSLRAGVALTHGGRAQRVAIEHSTLMSLTMVGLLPYSIAHGRCWSSDMWLHFAIHATVLPIKLAHLARRKRFSSWPYD